MYVFANWEDRLMMPFRNRRVKYLLLAVSVSALMSTGCSTKLLTYGADGNISKGVPVGTPKLVKITSQTSFKPIKADGNEIYCVPEISSEYKFMPVGETTYINFDPAELGKGDFKIEFTDSGILKSVSINSEANAGVDSFNNLASTLLPFLTAPKVASTEKDETEGLASERSAAVPDNAKYIKAKFCLNTGKTVVSIESVIIK